MTPAYHAEMMPVLLTWANPEEAQKAAEDTLVLENPEDLLTVFK